MRVSKGHSFFRPSEKRKSVINFRFSFFNFGKTTCKTKLSIYLKFIKGPTVFRVRGKRKANFETNFVFHFPKKVTLAQISFGKSFLGVKSRRSTPSRFFS